MRISSGVQLACRGGGAFDGTSLYGLFLVEELTRPGHVEPNAILCSLASGLRAGALDPMIGTTGSGCDIDDVSCALLSRRFKGKAVLRIP